MCTVSRSDIDIRAVLQMVCADPAIAGQIVRRYRALSREREYRRHYKCYRNLHFHVSHEMRRTSGMDSKFDALRKVCSPTQPSSGTRITPRNAKLCD
jgi:hypothetical protein